jgi:hypothetical protein
MPHKFGQSLFALFALCASSGRVIAQASDPRAGTTGELAKAIHGRSRIRVRLASSAITELQTTVVEGATLVGHVVSRDSVVKYQIEELEQVWRRGSAASSGFAIGALVGLVGGAVGGAAVGQICIMGCSRVSTGERVRLAAIGGLLGSVAGGTVGVLVGASFGRWITIYRTPRHQLTPIITTQRLGLSLTL